MVFVKIALMLKYLRLQNFHQGQGQGQGQGQDQGKDVHLQKYLQKVQLQKKKVVLEKEEIQEIQEKTENKIKIFKEKYIFTYIINANFCKNSYW